MRKLFVLFGLCVTFCACSSFKNNSASGDSTLKNQNNDPENIYLEEVRGEKALTWVNAQNARSLPLFEKDLKFNEIQAKALKIMDDPQKLIHVSFSDDWAYNFWKDAKSVRGIWRRMPLTDYLQGKNSWETLIDIDALAKAEGKNWVYGGSSLFKNRALVFLSDGGKDSKETREFDLNSKIFIKNGFELADSKSSISWINENEVFLGLADSKDEVTPSGYPKKVRLWKRGQNAQSSPIIYSGEDKDIWIYGYATRNEENGPEHYKLISRGIDFYNSELFVLSASGKLQKLNVPTDSEKEFDQDDLYLTLKSDWNYQGAKYKVGSLLKLKMSEILNDSAKIEVIFESTPTQFLMSTLIDNHRIFLILSENVLSLAVEAVKDGIKWNFKKWALPGFSEISFSAYSRKHQILTFTSQSFLQPQTIHKIDLATNNLKELAHAPSYFNSSDYEVHQHFAKSFDGTQIPYFQVNKKGLKLNGKNPTIVNAYGGFEVSRTPAYTPVGELAWLKDGGVWILANIRGGGEYGPTWHTQAIKENRQKVFNDLFAVSEDLIQRKVTSPSHLGAVGGSNGGLLMGVALTQRPDLYNAICIQVPLLDMMRYHKLLAGASWIGEYGDPEIESERNYILKYSPYQNLFSGKKYPEVFIMTSTADDRVHPGHARRMGAKLESLGYPFYYYENTEGGHGGSANNAQSAKWIALQYTYFWQKLK